LQKRLIILRSLLIVATPYPYILDESVIYPQKGRDFGWLRFVGSSKSQVSFAKLPYKRDDILQKRPIILRSLLIIAIPYPYILDESVIYGPKESEILGGYDY